MEGENQESIIMSSPSLIVVRDDSSMNESSPGPRAGGPARRRSISPAQKLDHLADYEEAVQSGGRGAYLREQSIYSSQITEWRKLRDAGVLAGKKTRAEAWPVDSGAGGDRTVAP